MLTCWQSWGMLKIACLCVCGVQEAVIEPGTTAYENWVAAGAKVYRQFWLFDVMNPLEVLEYGATPAVVERGPYTYMWALFITSLSLNKSLQEDLKNGFLTICTFRTRYLARDNITFHLNHTVTFLLPNGAIFEPSMSVGTEDDKITSLNLAVAVSMFVIPNFMQLCHEYAMPLWFWSLSEETPKQAVSTCGGLLWSANTRFRGDFWLLWHLTVCVQRVLKKRLSSWCVLKRLEASKEK